MKVRELIKFLENAPEENEVGIGIDDVEIKQNIKSVVPTVSGSKVTLLLPGKIISFLGEAGVPI